ncbi:MAG TPA: TadE family protein [Catenuloplanes sp.]|jgi:Flp pilus assembly protein TadG
MNAPHRRAGPPPPPSALGTARRLLRARWRRVAARPDAGGATAELVIAMPLLLFIIMFIVQAGVWMHATHITLAAATRAANAAAAYGASSSAGRTAGNDTLAAIGNRILANPNVSVTRTATEVRVEVSGTAQTVVPGIRWTAKAVVVRPVERFIPDLQAQGG